MAETALPKTENALQSAVILRQLVEMAERLKISSNQAILLYAGNNFWLNAEMSDVAVEILRKLATDKGIDLFDFEEPFIVTLAKRGVFTPDEQRLFGWKPQAEAEPAGTNGNGAKRRSRAKH